MLFWGKKKKRLPDIIVGFVLLENFSYDFNKLKINLKNEWGIEIKDTARHHSKIEEKLLEVLKKYG